MTFSPDKNPYEGRVNEEALSLKRDLYLREAIHNVLANEKKIERYTNDYGETNDEGKRYGAKNILWAISQDVFENLRKAHEITKDSKNYEEKLEELKNEYPIEHIENMVAGSLLYSGMTDGSGRQSMPYKEQEEYIQDLEKDFLEKVEKASGYAKYKIKQKKEKAA